MKFLFITAIPLSPIHGSGTYVGISTLARTLEKLGHSVEILSPQFWCPSFVLRRYLFNRWLACRLRYYIPVSHAPRGTQPRTPDSTLIIGFDCDGFYWAQTRNRSIPYIVSLKGILADEARQEKGSIRKILELQARWEKINVQNAALVLVTSEYCQGVAQEMYDLPQEKIRIVPELIDLEEWGRFSFSPIVRQREPSPMTVLTVCRMYQRKNLGLLLRAWVHVRKKHPSAQLRIVGSGQEYRRWTQLARELRLGESVKFLGDLTRENLAREYETCDIFCLPSRQEGFGIVFLEAMAAGKPVIATTAAAIPEVVHHEEHGLLVHTDSGQELTSALLRLIESPAIRQRLGQSGRKWVQQFDATQVAEQFLSTIQICLDRR